MRSKIVWIGIISFLSFASTLPTSIVEDVKASELKTNKVKRAHSETVDNSRIPMAYFNNPTAIKRGMNPTVGSWESKESLLNLSPSLYSSDDNQFDDDKSLLDYEKGYRYGTNKEKLDKDLENAVLKSELYGDPAYYNQYRYLDERSEDKKRKRRAIKNLSKYNNRYKRDVELTPEEVLTLLNLWENKWHNSQDDYKPTWYRYEPNLDLDDNADNEVEQDDEDWLDIPVVYPHASNRINKLPNEFAQENPNYIYEDKRGQWGRFSENKKKRFMVSRKRNDPTRELRYLNGPASRNDFYTLSQLLATSNEPNVPVYHRMVL